jgi:hypothetical protein
MEIEVGLELLAVLAISTFVFTFAISFVVLFVWNIVKTLTK